MVLVRRLAFARVVVIGLTGAAALSVAGRDRVTAADPAAPAQVLRLYYSAPMIVRPGERVAMPVDPVCATAEGQECETDVEFGSQVGKEPWRSARASAVAPLLVDLDEPASEVAPSGVVRFFVRAKDRTGKAIAFGAAQRDGALRFFVAGRMPIVPMPVIPFGEVRKGEPVLRLPWGSGSMRAGLELGNESDTLGPASFDVGDRGRIYLLDALQERLAIFDRAELVGESGLPTGPQLDVAAAEDGSAYVASRSGPRLLVRRVSPSGSVEPAASLGEALGVQLDVAGGEPVANLLPLDAWVSVPPPGDSLPPTPQIRMGRPLSEGDEIVRVVRGDAVRLATVLGDRVLDAVELTSTLRLGEVELAEADGNGGYWVVARIWQDDPVPADQYQVAHVRGTAVLDSFAVASEHFASVPPLNRFRLADGFLYQMTSSPEALEIVRYQLGGKP
jgi:hypothetical protein